MPWEKAFDMDTALDKATSVFAKKGFEATSMSDLTQAMQINKGSLYNAFGSKKELFDRALARYDQQNRAARLAELRQWDNPKAAIDALFQGLIDTAKADPEHLGCFVINTAQDMPNHSDTVNALIRQSIEQIETFFHDMIVAGQASGHIALSTDPEKTAKGLLSLFVGMRVLSRGGVELQAFDAIKSSAMQLLPAP